VYGVETYSTCITVNCGHALIPPLPLLNVNEVCFTVSLSLIKLMFVVQIPELDDFFALENFLSQY
jgi:hypothetical protein